MKQQFAELAARYREQAKTCKTLDEANALLTAAQDIETILKEWTL